MLKSRQNAGWICPDLPINGHMPELGPKSGTHLPFNLMVKLQRMKTSLRIPHKTMYRWLQQTDGYNDPAQRPRGLSTDSACSNSCEEQRGPKCLDWVSRQAHPYRSSLHTSSPLDQAHMRAHTRVCLTDPLFQNYSRLGWSPKKFRAVLLQARCLPVTQPTVSHAEGRRTITWQPTITVPVRHTCLTVSVKPSFKWFSRERFGFLCRVDEIVLASRKSHVNTSCRDFARGGFVNDGCSP